MTGDSKMIRVKGRDAKKPALMSEEKINMNMSLTYVKDVAAKMMIVVIWFKR